MNNLYIPISFPYSIHLDYRNFKKQQTLYDKNLLSQDIHNWIDNNIGALILWTEVFYLPPFASYSIHCDGHEIDNKCKLNYIINGDDSKFYWYEPKDPGNISCAYSVNNTKYLKLEKDDACEIGSAVLTGLNLVSVGTFHTVLNGNKDRYCISIVLGDIVSKKRLDFDEVYKRLNHG